VRNVEGTEEGSEELKRTGVCGIFRLISRKHPDSPGRFFLGG